MSPSNSFLSSESKVLKEADAFKNHSERNIDYLNESNYLDRINNKRNSVIIVKNSAISMVHSASKTTSPDIDYSSDDQHNVKRGRPKASSIPFLQEQARRRNNPLRCSYCLRDFKRKKALNTHLRTHTREKPYKCLYPSCSHKFTQSSHLDAHIRIHTKEKPFYCPVLGCSSDFTHQSRVCKLHMCPVKRKETKYGINDIEDLSTRSKTEQDWLIQYFQEKENKAANIRKKKPVNESNFVTEIEETSTLNSRRNEQNEGDELVIQETRKQKRKRSDIKENVHNKIQKVENFMHSSSAVDTKHFSTVLNENLFLVNSDSPSPPHTPDVNEDLFLVNSDSLSPTHTPDVNENLVLGKSEFPSPPMPDVDKILALVNGNSPTPRHAPDVVYAASMVCYMFEKLTGKTVEYYC